VRADEHDESRVTVGIIGTGNMGAALVRGWLRSYEAEVHLLVWDKVEASTGRLPISPRLGVAESIDDLAARADVVLVVVKPKDAGEVFGAIAGHSGGVRMVISSMAGVAIERMRAALGPGPVLFRIMPNLGVELGVGAIALASESGAPEADTAAVIRLLEPLGHVEAVPEELLDVVTAVSGSGPAFLALAMEGLEDGAVAAGLSRPAARVMVRQAALETARLLPYSGSPAGLKDRLAAGGDLDRDAFAVLQERGVQAAFRQAVRAALERSRRLHPGSDS